MDDLSHGIKGGQGRTSKEVDETGANLALILVVLAVMVIVAAVFLVVGE